VEQEDALQSIVAPVPECHMAAVTQRQSGAITAEGGCGARVVPVKSDATTLPNVALARKAY